MRRLLLLALVAVMSLPAKAQAPASSPPAPQGETPVLLCSDVEKGLPSCRLSRGDHKRASKEYKKGLQASSANDLAKALEHFKTAADISPRDVHYVTAREMTKQRLVFARLDEGNKALEAGKRIEALAAFRAVAELDPSNEFAQQRLRDALPPLPKITPTVEESPASEPIRLRPSAQRQSFQYRGSARQLLEKVARAYGLTPFLDESVMNRNVRFTLENVTWEEVLPIVGRVTKTFLVPLAPNQVLFVNDDDQNRRTFQRVALRTFFVGAGTPQELNDLTNTLRILFDIRYITQNAAAGTITVRASQPVVEAATRFLEQMDTARPQVMLDVKVFEVSETLARQVGTDIPKEFRVFNLPTEAQNLLGNRSIQDIIDQLISSGAINQGSSQGLAGLIAQALNNRSSLFAAPFAIFGGGITLSGLTIPPASVQLNANESSLKTLQHAILRANHNTPAVLKIGTRIPIINATFAPIFNSSALTQVLGNQSYIAPFPSFNYEDIGLNIKATPQIRREGDVTLALEMQLRGLGAQNVNGVPVISNREFVGSVTAQDGQSIVIAGQVNSTERRSLTGLPLVSYLPVLGRAVSTENNETTRSELLIVLTPRIVTAPSSPETPIIPAPSETRR